jgi:hypothetical protein
MGLFIGALLSLFAAGFKQQNAFLLKMLQALPQQPEASTDSENLVLPFEVAQTPSKYLFHAEDVEDVEDVYIGDLHHRRTLTNSSDSLLDSQTLMFAGSTYCSKALTLITPYKRVVWIKPIDDAETAAIRLEIALRELFPEESSIHEIKGGGKGRWWVSDRTGHAASSFSMASAIQEIHEKNLQPHMLSGSKHGSSSAGRFTVYIHYRFETADIRLNVQGNDKDLVDEITAVCERTRATLEQPRRVDGTTRSLFPAVNLRRPAWVAAISVSIVAATLAAWPGVLL